MLYETPKMELILCEYGQVFTLYVSNNYDPTLDKTPGEPSDNPWAE